MVGALGEHARTYLLVVGPLSAVAFAVPLFLVPLEWARIFRWRLPDDTDLAVYFGRCLGAVALVIAALAVRAGITGTGLPLVFDLLIASAALLTLVHVWGALRRIQPMTETVEIGFWAALTILGLVFYP